MPSSKWIGCCRTQELTLTNSRSDGCFMRSGRAPNIVVAMDWTDFDADNQATIMLSLVSRSWSIDAPGVAHGR